MPPADARTARGAAEDAAFILARQLKGIARVVPESETELFARELERLLLQHG